MLDFQSNLVQSYFSVRSHCSHWPLIGVTAQECSVCDPLKINGFGFTLPSSPLVVSCLVKRRIFMHITIVLRMS